MILIIGVPMGVEYLIDPAPTDRLQRACTVSERGAHAFLSQIGFSPTEIDSSEYAGWKTQQHKFAQQKSAGQRKEGEKNISLNPKSNVWTNLRTNHCYSAGEPPGCSIFRFTSWHIRSGYFDYLQNHGHTWHPIAFFASPKMIIWSAIKLRTSKIVLNEYNQALLSTSVNSMSLSAVMILPNSVDVPSSLLGLSYCETANLVTPYWNTAIWEFLNMHKY